jgi:hypothetical protein
VAGLLAARASEGAPAAEEGASDAAREHAAAAQIVSTTTIDLVIRDSRFD